MNIRALIGNLVLWEKEFGSNFIFVFRLCTFKIASILITTIIVNSNININWAFIYILRSQQVRARARARLCVCILYTRQIVVNNLF